MQSTSIELYPWQRVWVPFGTTATKDGYGLDTFESFDFKREKSVSKTRSLSDLDNERCLILVGEPAKGKSTAIAQYRAPAGTKIVLMQLNVYSDLIELISALDGAVATSNLQSGDLKIYLFMDGVDEGLASIVNIHNSIINWLDSKKASEHTRGLFDSLYVRMTCRSAVWSEIGTVTEQRLRSLYGETNVKIFELAALTIKEIREALAIESIDESAFLEKVRTLSLASFCGDPQSFRGVIGAFREGKLTATISRGDLFYEMILNKCREFNSAHKRQKNLTPEQRFRIASRIACYYLLTKKNAVSTSETDAASLSELSIESIIGDEFSIGPHKESIDSLAALREVFDSGVFALGKTNQKFVFQHLSDFEFLASWHLSKVQIPPSQLLQLLTSPHDQNRAIPQLQEVITWLATFNSDFFEAMQHTEPMLLIQCHRELTIPERKKITRSLLDNADDYRLVDSYDDQRLYSRLNYSGIERDLKQLLKSRLNVVSSRIAINIAGTCKVTSLEDDLFLILADTSILTYLRCNAMTALFSIGSGKHRNELLSYALDDHSDDFDDELKGIALSAMYPSDISTVDLLPKLTPVRNNRLYGAYKGFLDTYHDLIPVADLKLTIDFVTTAGEFDHDDEKPLERLRYRIIERAYEHLTENHILSSVASILKRSMRGMVGYPIPDDTSKRRLILQQFIEDGDDRIRIHEFVYNAHWLKVDDWEWLIDRFEKSSDNGQRIFILELLATLLDRSNRTRVERFLSLAWEAANPVALKFLIGPIDLDSDEAMSLKRFNAPRQTRQQQQIKPTSDEEAQLAQQRVDEVVNSIKSGEYEKLWTLFHFLGMGADYEFDIKKLKYWQSLGVPIHDDIEAWARDFLTKYNVNYDWFGSRNYDRREFALYKALIFLVSLDRAYIESVPREKLKTWIKITVYCSLNNSHNDLDENQAFVLEYMASNFQEATFGELMEQSLPVIKKDAGPYDLNKIRFLFHGGFGNKIWDYLLSGGEVSHPEFIIDLLFKEAPDLSIAIGQNFAAQFFRGEIDLDPRSIAIVTISKLFEYLRGQPWTAFWQTLRQNEKRTKTVFSVATGSIGLKGREHLAKLNDEQKADVLGWIIDQGFKRKNRAGGRTVPDDFDYPNQYKSDIVQSLIEAGTISSVNALEKLSSERPADTDLKWWLNRAREFMRRNTWMPPSPDFLRTMLNDGSKRLIRSDAELMQVVMESLTRFQEKLRGDNPVAHFLWNKTKRGYTPKEENALSDFVQMHLKYDLLERGIVINREVEIKRSTGKKDGERTDLFIQAILPSGDIASLVVETKRCLHKEVSTSMKTQLKDRYLKEYKSTTGIYLIGWYYCKHLKTPLAIKSFRNFAASYRRQATRLSTKGIIISEAILDCSI